MPNADGKRVKPKPPQSIALSEQSSIALGNFISEVISAPSEQMVYATLAQNLNAMIPNNRASVTLLNAEKDMLDVFSLHGCEGMLPVGKSLPLDSTYTGWAVQQQAGQLHYICPQTDTLDGKILFREGMRCILNAPIVIHGKSIGAINTATEDPYGFNDKSLEQLELVARLVSTNLERHKLLEQRQEALEKYRCYASQLENLNHLAQQLSTVNSIGDILQVCEITVQNVMPSQRVSYAVYQSESDLFKVTVLSGKDIQSFRFLSAAGTGLERVLSEKQPVYFPDLSRGEHSEHRLLHQFGLKSSWSIPIKVAGQVVAILSAASTETSGRDENLSQVLGAMSGMISGTLERLKANEKLNHQANYDIVTGLPNRHMLYDQLNKLINSGDSSLFSVLFVDLDHFKKVNDSLGHQVGDELLGLVAKRIRQVTRDNDLVARIGGDEFVVLMEENSSSDRCSSTAKRIIHSLSRPFNFCEKSICIGASIGICLSSEKFRCADDMIKAADTAMYDAKSKGKGTYRIS